MSVRVSRTLPNARVPRTPPAVRAALVLLALCGACATPRERWQATWQGPEDTLRPALHNVRRALEGGRSADAWRELMDLHAVAPGDLDVAVLLQDVELELVTRHAPTDPELARVAAAVDPRDALRKRYAQLSTLDPSGPRLILAARLETDALAAQNFLERALELDPDNPWAHYGMAHSILRQEGGSDGWLAAQAALARALELDTGHLRARRLDAWMQIQGGADQGGAYALERWLDESLDDPRVAFAERQAAKLDLAIVWILLGEPARARSLLYTLEGDATQRARRLALLAAAEQANGDLIAALDAARRAEGADRTAILPAVQQAMLFELWFDDPERAERKWREVIDRAADQDNLSALLQLLRAQVQLERAAAQRAES